MTTAVDIVGEAAALASLARAAECLHSADARDTSEAIGMTAVLAALVTRADRLSATLDALELQGVTA